MFILRRKGPLKWGAALLSFMLLTWTGLSGMTSAPAHAATMRLATPQGIAVTGLNITATAGVPFSGQVATVSDPNATNPGQLSAFIDWGDGSSPSAGTVSGTSPTFIISGTHTYATTGSFIIIITVTDTTTGLSSSSPGTATVTGPPSVQVSGQNIATTPD